MPTQEYLYGTISFQMVGDEATDLRIEEQEKLMLKSLI
jgi:hypothetical protein